MPIHYVMLARNTGLFSNINGVLNRLHHTNEENRVQRQVGVRCLNTEIKVAPFQPNHQGEVNGDQQDQCLKQSEDKHRLGYVMTEYSIH